MKIFKELSALNLTLLLLLSSPAAAIDHQVWVTNIDIQPGNTNPGQDKIGDVVDCFPHDGKDPDPTGIFKVFIVDITPAECKALLEPDTEDIPVDDPDFIPGEPNKKVKRFRKKKVNLKNAKLKNKHKKKVKKSDFVATVADKAPVAVSP